MFEVMECITYAWMGHAEVLVDIIKQHGHYPCLPIMAMDDVWALTCLEHKFKGGPAEKRKPFRVIVMAVEKSPVKKIPV